MTFVSGTSVCTHYVLAIGFGHEPDVSALSAAKTIGQ
jgi:hypothetical protein